MIRFAGTVVAFFLASMAAAQEEQTQTLLTNVHIFDGLNEARIENANVLVEGNPVEDVTVLVDYANNIDLIMKDGVIYKNALD